MTYRRYFDEEPCTKYGAIWSDGPPEIVIYHTAYAIQSEEQILCWLKDAKRKDLLVWLTSEDETLQGYAFAMSHTGTHHAPFQNWCKENLEPVESRTDPKRKDNLQKLAEYLSGLGKASLSHAAMKTSLCACDDVVEKKSVSHPLRRNLVLSYSPIDVPVDPRVRWLLLSAIAQGGTDTDQAREDLGKALKRMKTDVDILQDVLCNAQ